MTAQTLSIVASQVDLPVGVSSGAREHSAQQLRVTDLERADLILAMTRRHRRHAVELVPSKLRIAFTIREFARLAGVLSSSEVLRELVGIDEPVARLHHMLSMVSAVRGRSEPAADAADDDVVDPYGRSAETYRLTAAQLAPAVDEVSRMIRLVGSTGPG